MQLQVPSIRLLDGSSGGGSVAAMVPEQKKDGREQRPGELGRHRGRQAPGQRAAAARSCPATSASRSTPSSWPTVPVVNMLLGSVVGIGAAKAVLGHFSVMVRDIAQLFVAGPPVVSHAMGYDITKEDLGGWQVHCRNGSVDNLAETEEEAVAMTKRVPVVPAVERLRGAARRRRRSDRPGRPARGGAADARSRASARRRSTSAAPSS